MEAKTIFPIFGELHSDDSPAPVTQPEKPARKVLANDAGLFVVSAESEEQAEDDEPEKEHLDLRVTGEVSRDTVVALCCLVYLKEFLDALEPSDVCRIADRLRR